MWDLPAHSQLGEPPARGGWQDTRLLASETPATVLGLEPLPAHSFDQTAKPLFQDDQASVFLAASLP